MATVLIWKLSLRHGNVGHAAMQAGSAYISWWPNRADGWLGVYSGQAHGDWRQDKAAEGAWPDRLIPIPGLSDSRIQHWWEREHHTGSWRLWRHNCSTVVAEALDVGGLSHLAPGWNEGIHVWTPARLERALLRALHR